MRAPRKIACKFYKCQGTGRTGRPPAKDIDGSQSLPPAEVACTATISGISKRWFLCEGLRLSPSLCIVPHLRQHRVGRVPPCVHAKGYDLHGDMEELMPRKGAPPVLPVTCQ